MFGDGEDDDPFSCFGSDGSISSGVASSEDEQQHQGERLRRAANVRQSNTSTPTASIDRIPVTSPGFEVYSCSNQHGYEKGQFGIRAIRPYEAGEEIMREFPAMRINSAIAASSREEATIKFEVAVQETFDALSPVTAKAVMELSSCNQTQQDGGDGKTPLGIFQTNSFQLDDQTGFGGLFLTIARMNHSCRPNAVHYWRPDLYMMVVHAVRDISVGEELCTCYGPGDFFGTERRRSFLREKFCFECVCDMCIEGVDAGGDDRMAEIRSFHENIGLHMASKPEEARKRVERCLDLLREQGIGHPTGPHVAPVLHYGYQNSLTGLNDEAMAQSYLERELVSIQSSQGPGSYKAISLQRILSEMETVKGGRH